MKYALKSVPGLADVGVFHGNGDGPVSRPQGPDKKSTHTTWISMKNRRGWICSTWPKAKLAMGCCRECFSTRIITRKEISSSRFGSKPPQKKGSKGNAEGSEGVGGTGAASGKKKQRELRVLDPKSAQNLSIMLSGECLYSYMQPSSRIFR